MNRYITACIVVAASITIMAYRLHSTIHPAASKPTSIASNSPVISDVPSTVATQKTMPIRAASLDALDSINAQLKAARAGDRDAQFRIAKIMRGCPKYTHKDGTRISLEETIAPYQKYGTTTDTQNVRREFERCGRLWEANDLGTAGEWLDLATKAKQPQAMALTAEDLLWEMNSEAMFRNAAKGVNPDSPVVDPALDTTQDPRKLLREAIESNNPDVYYAISHNALLLYPGNPDALTLYYSWMLVACQRGLDCSKNSELAGYNCSRNMDACDKFKDPGDYALWLVSNSNTDISIVETRAAEITAKLDAGQYDDLGL